MKKFFKNIVIRILTAEAKIVLRKYKPKVVGITGNVGKTTTKEAVGLVLARFANIRKSEKSYNSEFGIPLTILGLSNAWNDPISWIVNMFRGLRLIILSNKKYPKILVLEIGAGKPGDIKSVAEWIKLDALIVTRFPDVPVHIEFFKSREHLIEEKSSLIHSLKPDGVLILNNDDADVQALKSGVPKQVLTFGLQEDAAMHSSNISAWYPDTKDQMPEGLQFKANYKGTSIPVFMRSAVSHIHVYAALAALSVADALGFSVLDAAAELSHFAVLPGRLSLVPGLKKTIIIDDTYNASPTAVEAALYVLEKFPKDGRKIAVLGDMLELGKHTKDAHEAIGAYAFGKCTVLITVGKRARGMAEGARNAGFIADHIFSFDTAIEAGEFLRSSIMEGDVVLLKASQGIRLERATEMILEHPEHASRLLPRQDIEWKKKK